MSFIKISETEHINPNTNEKVKCPSVTTDDNQKYLIINTREELDNLREELASEQAVLDSLELNNINGQDLVQSNNLPECNINNAYQRYSQSGWRDAIKVYNKLWNFLVFSYKDIIGYARSHRKTGEYRKAIALFEIAKAKNPNFNSWQDYYWSKYHSYIKVYCDDETKIKVATEIKEHFGKLPKEYTPYFKTCLSMAQWCIDKGRHADITQWLDDISYSELSTQYEYLGNYYTPDKAKYFLYLSEAHLYNHNFVKAIKHCFRGFNEYKNLYKLTAILTDAFTQKHQLQTELFDKLLASVGFQNGDIKDNYLEANVGSEAMSNWENSFKRLRRMANKQR